MVTARGQQLAPLIILIKCDDSIFRVLLTGLDGSINRTVTFTLDLLELSDTLNR